jgi:hypothetical protein
MKKILCVRATLTLLPLASLSPAQDMGKLVDSIDMDKAREALMSE